MRRSGPGVPTLLVLAIIVVVVGGATAVAIPTGDSQSLAGFNDSAVSPQTTTGTETDYFSAFNFQGATPSDVTIFDVQALFDRVVENGT